jgi:hypothetical protein
MFKIFQNKTKLLINSTLSLVLIFFVFTGCKKGCSDPTALNYDSSVKRNEPSTCEYGSFNKQTLLINLSDNFITPSIELYKSSVDSLVLATNNFSNETTLPKLEELKNAWKNSLLSWHGICILGPSKYVTTDQIEYTNIYPVDTNSVIENISGSLNPNNKDEEGFQTLDYLLFSKDAQSTVDYFTDNIFALQYLSLVVNNISGISFSIDDKWKNEKQNFIDDHQTVATGSSIGILVNAFNKHYEYYIRRGKFGLPLNVFDQFTQDVDPHLVECYFYGQSLPFAVKGIESLQNLINGSAYNDSEDNLTGFDDYLDFVGAQHSGINLSTKIDNQIDAILVSINGLNDPLSNEIIMNRTQVDNTYEELQQLVPLLKVDLTSALGVLITYFDEDGD